MEKSTIGSFFILAVYLVLVGIVFSAVSNTFGANSAAMYITVSVLGAGGLLLIATHKGSNKFLKGLDK